MGFCYQGRKLVCDICGRAPGTTRKRKCPHGACPSTAVCADCWRDPAFRAREKAAHAGCGASAARYRAGEAREIAMLAGGAALRRAALGIDTPDGPMVRVTFVVASGHTFDRLMTHAAYDAHPLMVPVTPEEYGVATLDPDASLPYCAACGKAHPMGSQIGHTCLEVRYFGTARNLIKRTCPGTIEEWQGARPGRPGLVTPRAGEFVRGAA